MSEADEVLSEIKETLKTFPVADDKEHIIIGKVMRIPLEDTGYKNMSDAKKDYSKAIKKINSELRMKFKVEVHGRVNFPETEDLIIFRIK